VLGFGRGCFSTELSRSLGRVRCSSVARSDPMTVGANDLALRDFRFDRIERGFVPTQLANSVELRLAWQVIEIERGWVGIVPTVSASTLQLDRVDDVHDTGVGGSIALLLAESHKRRFRRQSPFFTAFTPIRSGSPRALRRDIIGLHRDLPLSRNRGASPGRVLDGAGHLCVRIIPATRLAF
jgi:hypothetical protein